MDKFFINCFIPNDMFCKIEENMYDFHGFTVGFSIACIRYLLQKSQSGETLTFILGQGSHYALRSKQTLGEILEEFFCEDGIIKQGSVLETGRLILTKK